MKKYAVTFVQYHTYEVEANDGDEAENLANELFSGEWYDDVMIEQCEDTDE